MNVLFSTLRNGVFALFIMTFSTNAEAALNTIANFMLDEHGKVLQIRYIKKKEFTMGRGFPFMDVERGLALVENETQKVVATFRGDREKYGMILGAYALDSHRIVFRYEMPRPPTPRSGTAVWDARTKKVTDYYDSTDWVSQGRPSPDGTRYAFFSGNERNQNILVIRGPATASPVRVEFEQPSDAKRTTRGRNLAWSPSGKMIAGLVHSNGSMLYVWKADGSQVIAKHLNFIPWPDWMPLWSQDEKEVIMFERELMPREKPGKRKPLEMHRVAVPVAEESKKEEKPVRQRKKKNQQPDLDRRK